MPLQTNIAMKLCTNFDNRTPVKTPALVRVPTDPEVDGPERVAIKQKGTAGFFRAGSNLCLPFLSRSTYAVRAVLNGHLTQRYAFAKQ